MNLSTVTAHRQTSTPSSTPPYPGIATRVRRALTLAGTLGLLIGAVIGGLQTHPGLLSSLPVEVEPQGAALAGMALMGLICGVVAGLLLRGARFLLRLLVALIAILIGLLASILIQVAALPDDSLTLASDVLKLGQFGLGALGAIAGVQVGRRRVQIGPARPDQPAGASRRPSRRRSQPSEGTTSQPANGPVKISVPAAKRQRPRWPVWRRGKSVHLGKEVTSVCPYCLEEVKPNDPRGRVVCNICGTPHHGDCWAITGKCQVPHMQI